jgi:hypothetical protein
VTRLAVVLSSAAIAAALPNPLPASTVAAASGPGLPGACAILTRAEVKKVMPWPSALDGLEDTEEAYGTGTYCSYPGVNVWLGRYSASMIEEARKRGPLTPAPDVAPGALLHVRGKRTVALYVKLGDRLVMVESVVGLGESAESVTSEVIALGKVLVEKLR